jgi:hypothetical protein
MASQANDGLEGLVIEVARVLDAPLFAALAA